MICSERRPGAGSLWHAAACVAAIALLTPFLACSTDSSSVPPNVKCLLTARTDSCTCLQQDQTVFQGTVVVPICDEHPQGVAWECCHNVDTSGHTTFCDCAVWRCLRSNGWCGCGYGTETDAETVRVASCTGAVCVATSNSCQCSDDPNAVLGGDVTVPSCQEPATRCGSGTMSRPTCAGLSWKPPPPPRTGCINNGNACGPARQAVAACCSGYCGENGTCETR